MPGAAEHFNASVLLIAVPVIVFVAFAHSVLQACAPSNALARRVSASQPRATREQRARPRRSAGRRGERAAVGLRRAGHVVRIGVRLGVNLDVAQEALDGLVKDWKAIFKEEGKKF